MLSSGHNDADGIDYVVVFYRAPGSNADGWQVYADYFRLSYYVDNHNA